MMMIIMMMMISLFGQLGLSAPSSGVWNVFTSVASCSGVDVHTPPGVENAAVGAHYSVSDAVYLSMMDL
jgi:hypothetical protein